ncbi:MAG TPA: 2-thiouracil desulfurase family protein, partial [Candidatus Goldiibacteriota bacterium]|nr:2-thiouracil desulfurase family protein [Candidatus Goldiibacteriota bacterium]
MEGFARPRIYISKCITFEPVRYSGEMISSDFVSALRPHVDAITHCPEVEIGLGIPRKTLRIVADDREMKKLRLIQPDTGLDFTEKMKAWTQKTLDSLPELDGFILKGKSPSSGAYDVKIYPAKGEKPSAITGKASGFFGGAVLERFPEYPVEDEGRLTDE